MVVEVTPSLDPRIQGLCRTPYPRHPKGCPNYGRKPGCPPGVPMFDSLYDCSQPVFAVVSSFDLGGHARAMMKRHPQWSEAQLYCLLYWQPRARKTHRKEVAEFLETVNGYVSIPVPEAYGVNVTETLRRVGIDLEWPPRSVARQVSLVAIPLE